MKETVFQQELKKTIEEAGGWCKKFPDSIRTAQTRFIPEKPADLIAYIENTNILIECKMIKKIKSIPYSFFGNTKEKKNKVHWEEYHQYKELIEFTEKTNGMAYYAINIRVQEPKRINKMILINVHYFKQLFSFNDRIEKEDLEMMSHVGINGGYQRFDEEEIKKTIYNDKLLYLY